MRRRRGTTLMEAIDRDEAASDDSCAEMRRILLEQKHNDMLPARLPRGVRVAHKTGSITAVRNDTAIVYAPFGTYYLTILTDRLKRPEDGVRAIAELSKLIHDERAKLKN